MNQASSFGLCAVAASSAQATRASAGRRALLAGLALGLAATVSGCGFELRRAPELAFQSIQLSGFKPHSPLAEVLRRSISASTTTRLVESASQAQVILESLGDTRDKGITTQGAAGQVQELQLRQRLTFRLRTLAGKELIPPTEIAESRDMTFNEGDALGKEQEEELLYRAMEADIASQVLRRLAAVKSL